MACSVHGKNWNGESGPSDSAIAADPLNDSLPEGSVGQAYLRYASWLAGVLRAQGAGQEIADDIVQETYIRITRYGPRNIISQPKALLLQIAKNILRDQFRAAERRRQPSFRLGLLAQHSNCADAHQFETVLLKQIVRALPTECRDVFVLHRFDGMSYAEIASLRKLSVKTIERRMSQALALCAVSLRA